MGNKTLALAAAFSLLTCGNSPATEVEIDLTGRIQIELRKSDGMDTGEESWNGVQNWRQCVRLYGYYSCRLSYASRPDIHNQHIVGYHHIRGR